MKTLKNKIAVVTGGNSGIGYASAKELAAQGATVVIVGRNSVTIQQAAEELGVIGFTADQTDLKSIDKLVAFINYKFGQLDILFLNAGNASFAPIEQATEEHFDNLINTNLKGTYFTLQKLLPLFNNGGSIIFNTSVNASLAMTNSSVYAASKAALLAVNKVAAGELAPRQIRVNAISPGPVQTPLYGKLGLQKEEVEGFGSALGEKILLKRFGESQEIANAVVFLASDASKFITGTELVVDGGLTVNTVL